MAKLKTSKTDDLQDILELIDNIDNIDIAKDELLDCKIGTPYSVGERPKTKRWEDKGVQHKRM